MTELARRNAEKAKGRLEARMQSLQEEIRDLEAQLKEVNAFIDAFNVFENLEPDGKIPASGLVGAIVAVPEKNPPRKAIVDIALAVIEDAKRPMKRRELFDAVVSRGVSIRGKDPLVVFSTMLWREQDRISRLDGFGYWPANKPYPPAGHMPEQN